MADAFQTPKVPEEVPKTLLGHNDCVILSKLWEIESADFRVTEIPAQQRYLE